MSCIEDCLTDAGPPPPPDPTAVTVDPSALEITGAVDPAMPGGAIDNGWFTYTVMVTNPRPYPVIVSFAPSRNGVPPITFAWDVKFLTIRTPSGDFPDPTFAANAGDMANATRFAAGETKRIVDDYRVGDHGFFTMPPGRYVFTAYYNGFSGPHASAPDTVTLAP